MTPPAPDSDPASYVAAVLILYVELPETPLRASVQDQWQARRVSAPVSGVGAQPSTMA